MRKLATILVTGGAGAIGSNLSNWLAGQGHHTIVLDDLSSGFSNQLNPNITFMAGSACHDQALDDIFSAFSIDYIFHLAALFANQNSAEHPLQDLIANNHSLIKVLERATARGVKKVLFTSSSCIYGNHANLPETPDTFLAFSADTPYAISKYGGEQYCRFWSSYHHLDTVIVRLFNSYGPGEYPGKYRNVIPNFIHLSLAGQPLPITGTGEEIRDFNYVGDTIQGLVKAMFEHTNPGDIFNIASGSPTRIIDLALKINTLCHNKSGIDFRPPRSWDSVKRRVGCIDKARHLLNYCPTTSLDAGLQHTLDWFQTIHPSLKKMP